MRKTSTQTQTPVNIGLLAMCKDFPFPPIQVNGAMACTSYKTFFYQVGSIFLIALNPFMCMIVLSNRSRPITYDRYRSSASCHWRSLSRNLAPPRACGRTSDTPCCVGLRSASGTYTMRHNHQNMLLFVCCAKFHHARLIGLLLSKVGNF